MLITYPQLKVLTGSLLLILMLSSACKDKKSPEPPVLLKAAFSAIPFEGHSPLTVQFVDESTGSPVSFKWDFQDDGTFDAFISNPSYTYGEPGFYSVKLVVSDSKDIDSLTFIDYIYLNRDDVQLNYKGILSPKAGEVAEIPLKVGHDSEFGAMTIKLFYDKRLIKVEAIQGGPAGLVSSIVHENGSIAIAWSSVTPFILEKNDDLFTIKATILTRIDTVSHYVRIKAGTEFADPNATIIPDVELILPSIDTRE